MNSLKKNLLINVSYQLLVVVIPLVVAPYVSRTVGAEGVGIYSYTFNFAYCFALVGMLGVSNYGNRTIAAVGEDKHLRSRNFWNIWAIQILMSLLACAAYGIWCLAAAPQSPRIALVHLITVACSIFDISWFFFGIEKFQITVARNLVVKVLNMALIFGLVKGPEDLAAYTAIMVGGNLLNHLLLFPFLRKEVVFVRPSFREMKQHFKPMVVLFFPVVAVSIYKIMDKVMIGALSTTTQTGFYEYAEKIIGLPVTLITAVGAVMLPRLSAMLGKNQQDQARKLTQVTMEVMMALTWAMAWGIFAIAPEFAPAFFGAEFAWGGVVMMGLAPSVICQSWANVIRTQHLIPAKMDKVYVGSTWVGAGVNLVMNLLLIPRFHALGAAIGTLCAEFAVAAYQTFHVRRVLPIGRYFINSVYYLIPSGVMVVLIRVMTRLSGLEGFGLIALQVAVGGLAYCALALPWLLKRFRKLR
jgi:O-antigen/teichoic acid export membrane protein